LGYTAKNDAILDEHRFIRVSENLPDVEYSLKKGYAPEQVALDKLPKKLKREKASRLTIKIDGYDLKPYKSLMESLWKVGVKSHITNEEKDVENTYHTDSRMVRVWVQGEDMPYHIRYNDFAWTCETLEEVLSWVPMLDAHGLCLYPTTDDVPYSILQQIAESAWESNNKQVSMLLKGEDGYYCTILPEERDLVAKYPGYTVRQIETQLLSEYNSKEPDVVTIENPLVRVSTSSVSIDKIERSGKELRVFTSLIQGSDLWISYDAKDVIVADGYSGNIFLKTIEGSAKFLMGEIKQVFKKNLLTKLAALIVAGGVKQLKKRMSADEVGGTPLLGISKPVIKAHGSSGEYAIKNAVRQAMQVSASGIVESIAENVDYMRLSRESEQE
jgi:hypothetical protein